jgi:SRSO17 transposase
VVTQEQIMVAAEISIESLDTANLRPMIETANAELKAAGVEDRPGVVLADAGYGTNEAIEALVGQGIQTLVAPDADKRKETASRPSRRPLRLHPKSARNRLGRRALPQTPTPGTVEPVFGQIKSNRGANRFLGRGRSAVRSEWRLVAATHNLRKLYQHQLAAS